MGRVLFDAACKADGALAGWDMQETGSATVAVDFSGNGLNGTYAGSPTLGAAALFPGTTSASFTTGSGMSVTGVADLVANWTIELWAQFSNANGAGSVGDILYSRWTGPSSTGAQALLFRNPDVQTLEFDIPFVAAILTSTHNYVQNTPYHIILTRSSNTYTLMSNVTGSMAVDTTATNSNTQKSCPLIEFGVNAVQGAKLNGLQSFPRVYSTALSLARAQAHYAAALATDPVGGTVIVGGAGVSVGSGLNANYLIPRKQD